MVSREREREKDLLRWEIPEKGKLTPAPLPPEWKEKSKGWEAIKLRSISLSLFLYFAWRKSLFYSSLNPFPLCILHAHPFQLSRRMENTVPVRRMHNDPSTNTRTDWLCKWVTLKNGSRGVYIFNSVGSIHRRRWWRAMPRKIHPDDECWNALRATLVIQHAVNGRRQCFYFVFIHKVEEEEKRDKKILTAGEGVQQRGVRGGCRGRTVLLFGFADLGVALGKFQPDRLRDVRIESHALYFFVVPQWKKK